MFAGYYYSFDYYYCYYYCYYFCLFAGNSKKKNARRDEELRVLRAEAQRRRREFKQNVASAVLQATNKMKAKLEKFLVSKMEKVANSKMKKLSQPFGEAIDNIAELEQQLEDQKAELNDKFDEEAMR